MGGAERVILTQAMLLQKYGHSVDCQFAYLKNEHLFKTSNLRFDTYISMPLLKNEIIRLGLSILLAPFIAETVEDADLLICHGYGPSSWIGYNVKRARGKKYISYIHSLPRFLYLNPEMKKNWNCENTRKFISRISTLARPLLEGIDRIGVLNSETVLANSCFTAQRIKDVYGIRSIVCYPPINTDMFRPINNSEEIDDVLRRSALSRPLIFSAGRIVPIKRWEWLIEAMAHVIKTSPSATLAVAGEITRSNADYVNKLIKLSESLDIRKNVKFLGFLQENDLVKLYNAADVFAYSVPEEDFGLGPVEAMACGTPAIVWDDKAGPCETVVNKRTGFRAEPYNIKDFAEKIQDATNLEWDKSELIDFAKENFGCQKHIAMLRSVISSLYQ